LNTSTATRERAAALDGASIVLVIAATALAFDTPFRVLGAIARHAPCNTRRGRFIMAAPIHINSFFLWRKASARRGIPGKLR
jgi:hypothetical protein